MSNIQSRPASTTGRPMQRRSGGSSSSGGSNGGSNNGRRPPSGGSNGSNGGSNSRSTSSGVRRPSNGGEMNAGHAATARDRFLEKAREALSFGDRVMAENFFQHADHYNRTVLMAEEKRQSDGAYNNYKREASEASRNAQVPQAAEVVEEISHNLAEQTAPIEHVSIVAEVGNQVGFDDNLMPELAV